MEFGPDGRLYMLEYGSGWFTANKDSGLSYLKYNEGNRPPQLNSFTADHSSGPAPLTVALTADAVDGEDGKMTYQWDFGDGTTETTESGTISHEYADPGSYEAKVEIYDEQNMKVSSQIIDIVSGNTRPEIEIEITEGNSSFYMEGVPVMYDVSVSDLEDGQGDIDMGRLIVNVEYLEGFDEASLGHIEADPVANGQALTLELTCKTCHKADGESIGPSYTLVAEKYKDDSNVVGYLTEKIQKGGSGVWGANAMAANPDVTDAMARDMIRYIMSLSPDAEERSLPPSGAITPEAGNDQKQMIITASYTDNGAPGAVPLTNVVRKVLSSNFVSVLSAVEIVDWQKFKFDGMDLLILPRSGGTFALENVDLSGVKNINLIAGWQKAPTKPVELEIRNGGPDGEVIGKGGLLPPEEGSSQGVIALTLGDGISGKHDKITFTYNPDKEDKLGMLDAMAVVGIQFSGE